MICQESVRLPVWPLLSKSDLKLHGARPSFCVLQLTACDVYGVFLCLPDFGNLLNGTRGACCVWNC